jgi:hypothetical protein
MLTKLTVAPKENSVVFIYFRGPHIHFKKSAESQALIGVF